MFVERAYQLLKPGGICSIILPQSIFTTEEYGEMRKFILSNFEILTLCQFGDITFSGTSTSPTIIFMKKRKETSKNLDYQVLVLNSPKMLKQSTKKEKEFLGYEFSKNRNKLGIQEINKNLKENYSSIIKNWILDRQIKNSSNNQLISIKNIKDLIVNNNNQNFMIYPNKRARKNYNWKTLEELGFYISEKNENNNNNKNINIKYIEIGDISNSKIKIKSNKKPKGNEKICKKGDIIFSSLTPSKSKVAIADNDYYVSNAIFIIRHKEMKMIDWLFNYFMENETIFNDINCMLDGFKITYAKITSENLLKNIYFETEKFNKI